MIKLSKYWLWMASGATVSFLVDWRLCGLFCAGSAAYSLLQPQKLSSVETPEVEKAETPEGTNIGTKRNQTEPFIISDKSLNTHMLVSGTTGGGKTVSVSNFVESFITRGLPVIYIDGKGDTELAGQIERFALANQRPYFGFAMVGVSCQYNPLASGGYSSKKDRLIELREWSEAHYRKLAEGYLQTTFKILAACNIEVNLLSAAEYLDRTKLISLLRETQPENAKALIEELQDQEEAEKN